jgi:Skp family chaperone for outer membrane proteins
LNFRKRRATVLKNIVSNGSVKLKNKCFKEFQKIMKKISVLAVSLFLMTFLAVSASAQTGQGKIAVINTYAFGAEKEGITKYISAVNTLNAEFKPLNTELTTMQTKLQTLATEIDNINKLLKSNPKAVDEKSAQAKVDEAEKLQRDIKFKQEEGKARFEKRQQAVLGPVLDDIYKAVQEFAKQKGYMMILDGAKLEESGILVGITDAADITKEFVTFYNARPAATAATATPK